MWRFIWSICRSGSLRDTRVETIRQNTQHQAKISIDECCMLGEILLMLRYITYMCFWPYNEVYKQRIKGAVHLLSALSIL
jgi:hypothetical protein